MPLPVNAPELVVVERIEWDPVVQRRLVGAGRVVGHHVRIVVDFPEPDSQPYNPSNLVSYFSSRLLHLHYPSEKAVFRIMCRFSDGEPVALPCDLSDWVRRADPPFPDALCPPDADERRRLEVAAANVDVEVLNVTMLDDDLTDHDRLVAEPLPMMVNLRLNGRPTTMKILMYADEGAEPLMAILGHHHDRLDPVECHALKLALLRPELAKYWRAAATARRR